jgi:hypothetical protein
MSKKPILTTHPKPKARSLSLSNAADEGPKLRASFPKKKTNQPSGSYGSRGNRGPELTLRTVQRLTLAQKQSLRLEKYFTETCLPRTKTIAFDSCELLLPLVRTYPSSWSFVDKVVVMLAPGLREEVEKYYANEGKCMDEIYLLSQIEYLDQLLARDLKAKLKTLTSQKD